MGVASPQTEFMTRIREHEEQLRTGKVETIGQKLARGGRGWGEEEGAKRKVRTDVDVTT